MSSSSGPCQHLSNGEWDDPPYQMRVFGCLDCGLIHSAVTWEAVAASPAALDVWTARNAEFYHRLIERSGGSGE